MLDKRLFSEKPETEHFRTPKKRTIALCKGKEGWREPTGCSGSRWAAKTSSRIAGHLRDEHPQKEGGRGMILQTGVEETTQRPHGSSAALELGGQESPRPGSNGLSLSSPTLTRRGQCGVPEDRRETSAAGLSSASASPAPEGD